MSVKLYTLTLLLRAAWSLVIAIVSIAGLALSANQKIQDYAI